MSRTASPLLFCIGATKAGTSWLHAQLAEHPGCHLRTLKELHYFDALENGRLAQKRAEVEGLVSTLLGRMLDADDAKCAELGRRIEDRGAWAEVLALGREDTDAYLAYLTEGAEGRLVADITPAYALLPEARLRQMAGLVPDVKFLYLMRDPLDRLWSHVRMNSRRRTGGDAVDPAHAHRMLAEVVAGRHRDIARRSDYAAVLDKLDDAVPADRRLVLFYEDLFGGDGVARLCDFLGIAQMRAETGRRVHAGAPADLEPEAAAQARRWLAGQYDAVARRFGALPAAWRAMEAKA